MMTSVGGRTSRQSLFQPLKWRAEEMADILHAWASGVKLILLFGGSGALFAAGFAFACKWLGWAPVNITVHVHNFPPPTPEEYRG